MATFPTLSRVPTISGWGEEAASDATIRAKSEGGYTKTRPRTTRIPMKYKVLYEYLTATDRTNLQAFELVVKIGADAFNWTHPISGATKSVRLTEPIKYKLMPKNPTMHSADLSLEDV